MVVSKKICQQIAIGDFRISNNLIYHQQPSADVWEKNDLAMILRNTAIPGSFLIQLLYHRA